MTHPPPVYPTPRHKKTGQGTDRNQQDIRRSRCLIELQVSNGATINASYSRVASPLLMTGLSHWLWNWENPFCDSFDFSCFNLETAFRPSLSVGFHKSEVVGNFRQVSLWYSWWSIDQYLSYFRATQTRPALEQLFSTFWMVDCCRDNLSYNITRVSSGGSLCYFWMLPCCHPKPSPLNFLRLEPVESR